MIKMSSKNQRRFIFERNPKNVKKQKRIKNLAQIFDNTKIVRMAFLIKFGTKIDF